jgi:integrase
MDPSDLEGRTEEYLTVNQCLTDYLRDHVEAVVGGRRKVADPQRVRDAIKNLRPGLGDMAVKDVDIPACRAYVRQREAGEIGRKSQAGTIRRELGALTAAINHAVKWKRLPKADAPYVELPAAPPPRERWLTYDELAQLIEAAEPRIANFIRIAYWTAARKKSIEDLTWFQVDLERDRIRLNPEGRSQTKKRRPVVPIAHELKPYLQAMYDEKSEGPVLGGKSIRKGFEKAVAACGFRDVTPHTLRHTRAVHMAQAGTSLYDIAGLLGDSIATVEKNYLHHCPDHLAAALKSRKDSQKI